MMSNLYACQKRSLVDLLKFLNILRGIVKLFRIIYGIVIFWFYNLYNLCKFASWWLEILIYCIKIANAIFEFFKIPMNLNYLPVVLPCLYACLLHHQFLFSYKILAIQVATFDCHQKQAIDNTFLIEYILRLEKMYTAAQFT